LFFLLPANRRVNRPMIFYNGGGSFSREF